jgi:3',5'-cyclic AMP phosphodiesterase CpdA
MVSLIHISDLHFGPKFNQHLSELVLQDILATKPDLTIISGDFTMRGLVGEYEQARAYLDRIPRPLLTIPGNHDQPLYLSAMAERIRAPWSRYLKFIHGAVDASISVPGAFVVGVNDNHPIVPGGIWSSTQRAWIKSQFTTAPQDACKVFVMHHQLNWDGRWRPFGQWFPNRHLDWLAGLGVELVLNGHTHIPLTVRTRQGIIIAQAGTSMSTRVRHGQGNAYNRVTISPDMVTVRVMGYDATVDRFQPIQDHTFERLTTLSGTLAWT